MIGVPREYVECDFLFLTHMNINYIGIYSDWELLLLPLKHNTQLYFNNVPEFSQVSHVSPIKLLLIASSFFVYLRSKFHVIK
jgi:hypothetical protein